MRKQAGRGFCPHIEGPEPAIEGPGSSSKDAIALARFMPAVDPGCCMVPTHVERIRSRKDTFFPLFLLGRRIKGTR